MHTPYIAFVYFFYGLAFFTMGLMVAQEGGRGSDPRLRLALRPLTGFGLMHGIHEWLEMFQGLPITEKRKIQAQFKAKGYTANSAPPWGRIMQEEIPPPKTRKRKKK